LELNPRANSTLTNGVSAKIFGWTEPGTKIVVNGQKVPVTNMGFSWKNSDLSIKGNILRVKASNPNGSEEEVRSFVIEQ